MAIVRLEAEQPPRVTRAVQRQRDAARKAPGYGLGDAENAAIEKAAAADPDARLLTKSELAELRPYRAAGRPLGSGKKERVTISLDRELVAQLRASGPGWQTRANDALQRWVRRTGQ